MFSVLISYFIIFFTTIFQIFLLGGLILVLSESLNFNESFVVSTLCYVIFSVFLAPYILLSVQNLQRSQDRNIINILKTFSYRRKSAAYGLYSSERSAFIELSKGLFAPYLVINQSLFEELSSEELGRYIEIELLFHESFASKLLYNQFVVLNIWYYAFCLIFFFDRRRFISQFIFIVPRRAFHFVSRKLKINHFKNMKLPNIADIGERIILLEKEKSTTTPFMVSTSTILAIDHLGKKSIVSERFKVSEII